MSLVSVSGDLTTQKPLTAPLENPEDFTAMSNVKDLEKRVTAVEGEMKEVRTLAAGASQDAADYMAALRGHKMSLEALHSTQQEQFDFLKQLADTQVKHFAELGVTQLEQSSQIRALHGMVQAVDGRVQALDGRVQALDAKFDAMSGEMTTIQTTLLEQQAGLDKLRDAEMRQWTEMQDIRRTQLKHYADHRSDAAQLKAGLAGIQQLLESRGGDAGKAES